MKLGPASTVNRNLELWRFFLESKGKGFRLSWTKAEYMRCEFSRVGCKEGKVSLEGQIVPKRGTFRGINATKQ
jgi:hypothetical protein